MFLKSRQIFLVSSCLQVNLNKYSTRVRFAPSPTGYLHVGGLKTALLNWLFAKKNNGVMILRVEDTDRTRFVEGAAEHLVEALQWAGIKFDEGLTESGKIDSKYMQSNRLSLYKSEIDKLLKEEKVYRCFCSNARLELLRKEQARRKETRRYDRACLNLSQKEIDTKLSQGIPFSYRLKLELEGKDQYTIEDIVYGNVEIPMNHSDPILMKSDGFPVYHLANVIDDSHMEISHVIRGTEWLTSTPLHLAIYKALGYTPPRFAHLPLILRSDGRKISKRNQDFSQSIFNVDWLIKQGYDPVVVCNWLMSIGGGLNTHWSPDLTSNHLVDHLDLPSIQTQSTQLSQDLLTISSHLFWSKFHLTEDNFQQKVRPYLQEQNITNIDYKQIARIFDKIQDRIHCASDISQYQYLWQSIDLTKQRSQSIIDFMCNKSISPSQLHGFLVKFMVYLDGISLADPVVSTQSSNIIDRFRDTDVPPQVVFQIIRYVITGDWKGLKIQQLIDSLGPREMFQRLRVFLSEFDQSENSSQINKI